MHELRIAPWFNKLDRSAIDLGKGKRLIVRGGRYDSEFRITAPERCGAERRQSLLSTVDILVELLPLGSLDTRSAPCLLCAYPDLSFSSAYSDSSIMRSSS